MGSLNLALVGCLSCFLIATMMVSESHKEILLGTA